MDGEDDILETASDRCTVCGATLTPDEQEALLESGGPALCAVHADEIVPIEDEDEGEPGD